MEAGSTILGDLEDVSMGGGLSLQAWVGQCKKGLLGIVMSV